MIIDRRGNAVAFPIICAIFTLIGLVVLASHIIYAIGDN